MATPRSASAVPSAGRRTGCAQTGPASCRRPRRPGPRSGSDRAPSDGPASSTRRGGRRPRRSPRALGVCSPIQRTASDAIRNHTWLPSGSSTLTTSNRPRSGTSSTEPGAVNSAGLGHRRWPPSPLVNASDRAARWYGVHCSPPPAPADQGDGGEDGCRPGLRTAASAAKLVDGERRGGNSVDRPRPRWAVAPVDGRTARPPVPVCRPRVPLGLGHRTAWARLGPGAPSTGRFRHRPGTARPGCSASCLAARSIPSARTGACRRPSAGRGISLRRRGT